MITACDVSLWKWWPILFSLVVSHSLQMYRKGVSWAHRRCSGQRWSTWNVPLKMEAISKGFLVWHQIIQGKWRRVIHKRQLLQSCWFVSWDQNVYKIICLAFSSFGSCAPQALDRLIVNATQSAPYSRNVILRVIGWSRQFVLRLACPAVRSSRRLRLRSPRQGAFLVVLVCKWILFHLGLINQSCRLTSDLPSQKEIPGPVLYFWGISTFLYRLFWNRFISVNRFISFYSHFKMFDSFWFFLDDVRSLSPLRFGIVLFQTVVSS